MTSKDIEFLRGLEVLFSESDLKLEEIDADEAENEDTDGQDGPSTQKESA